jgi:hypothetical protein
MTGILAQMHVGLSFVVIFFPLPPLGDSPSFFKH